MRLLPHACCHMSQHANAYVVIVATVATHARDTLLSHARDTLLSQLQAMLAIRFSLSLSLRRPYCVARTRAHTHTGSAGEEQGLECCRGSKSH